MDYGGGKMNAPGRDGFVAKHASDDSLTWLDRSLGNGDQIVTSVDVDGSGDAFVFGTYRWTNEIGPLLGSGPAGGDETDVFVGKRGADGTPAWARHAGGTGADTIVGRVDAAGNAFVTGSHDGTINFGTTNLVAGAGPQVYLAKLGPSGNELFAKQFTGNATATAITVTPTGAPMIAGFASNQVARRELERSRLLPGRVRFFGRLPMGGGLRRARVRDRALRDGRRRQRHRLF